MGGYIAAVRSSYGSNPWHTTFPQTEAEAEANIGTEMVRSVLREAPSFEYAAIAKSLVMSTPDTRMGLTSSPYCFSRENVTQDS